MRTRLSAETWGDDWMPVSGPAGAAAETLLDVWKGDRLVVQAAERQVEYRRGLPENGRNVAIEIQVDPETGRPL
jgi:hypothetical protein